jgi:hypothetical protein
MQFKEIHTDTVLTTNRESGLDSTARRIHTDMAPMANREPGQAGQTFTSCLSKADSCGHSADDE